MIGNKLSKIFLCWSEELVESSFISFEFSLGGQCIMQVKLAAPAAFGANCTFALAAAAVAAAVGKTQQQQQSELKLELDWALQGPVGLSPCCHGNNQLLMENCMDVSNQPTLCLLSVRMSVAV